MPANQSRDKKSVNLAHPRYLGTWLAIGIAHVLARLPYSLGQKIGLWVGQRLRASKKPLHVASTNISRSFPDLDSSERNDLVTRFFRHQGLDLFETMVIWCRNGQHLVQDVDIKGMQHLTAALSQNKGIILMSSHFGNVDMSAMLMSWIGRQHGLFSFSATYREQPNPVLDRFMTQGRGQYFDKLIAVDNMRQVARDLKSGQIVWYAPDMNVDKKNSVFVPFMGIPASTTTAISRLAKLSDAIVLPYAHYRLPGKYKYRVNILPPLSNFPSNDVIADTARINNFVEDLVKQHPEKYWWILRRFKTRPAGEPSFY
ncbi:MAG: KDO2-lipid IV(A) lauroyltransferase [Gammaproteobacteria bacterium]|jgi:KDO2-lipid IV(A) lauroyltransferase